LGYSAATSVDEQAMGLVEARMDVDDLVRAECFRLANRNLFKNAVAFPISALVLFLMMRHRSQQNYLLVWIGLGTITSAIVVLTAFAASRKAPVGAAIDQWVRREVVMMVVVGATWGSGSFALTAGLRGHAFIEASLIVMVFQLGAISVNMVANASVRAFFLAYAVPLVAGPSLRGLLGSSTTERLFGLGSIGFMVLITLYHGEIFRYVTTSLRLRHEMADVNTELIEAIAKIEALTRHDDLTGLHNRRHFVEVLQQAVDNGTTEPFCVALLDIDRFKEINDGYGHAVGDDVLRGLGALFATMVRDRDCIGRFGGEEFAVLLTGSKLEGGRAFVERLRTAVAETQFTNGLTVTISAGIVAATAGITSSELLVAADRSLYAAKAAGRNRVMTSA
jgi:diguanylate cyclase (GGDEF)-like protein